MSSAPLDTRSENLLKLVRYATEHAHIIAATRDAAIREAHRAGASVYELTNASGIVAAEVERIVQRSAS